MSAAFLSISLACVWIFGSPAIQNQPPSAEKNRSYEAQTVIPLERLPVPENGVIVVTPDLKKALDTLGAGSVVLSAERYQELMKRAEKAKSDKTIQEILFARCSISGEVKTSQSREIAEITFELEFRTDTSMSMVPIPLKGLRISSASLNGQPPIWGPDPEKLTLLVKDPQVCRLKVTANIPVTRVGNEKRLTLERLPASAITSLELLVPGTATNAMVQGYGGITNSVAESGFTRLSAPALGVLTTLEMNWQSGESSNAASPPTIEGDIRISVDEGFSNVEARFKPIPFAHIQLPWKVRVPVAIQQLRAELARTEGSGSEPLIVTRLNDGLYVISSPYPLVTSAFSHVVLRWRQGLPESEASESILIGSCEILEPAGRIQNGTIQLNLPDDPVVMLHPRQLTRIDSGSERESRRIQRFRYTQQPASLEATVLPRAQTRGVLETRLQHTLAVQPGGWKLTTEIDIVRTTRGNLSQLEFTWPADWIVSRNLLFSPAVKELEQDTAKQKLKLLLDGRQPGSLSLKLESQLSGNPKNLSLTLPQLITATGLQNDRTKVLEIVATKDRFKLQQLNCDVEVVADANVLEEQEDVPGLRDNRMFQVSSHPAIVHLTRQPRLPKYRSKIELYVGSKILQTKQEMEIRWTSAPPRQLAVLVPRGADKVEFIHVSGEKSTALSSVSRNEDELNPWITHYIDMPITNERGITLTCLCEVVSKHPITVPLVRLAESVATLEGLIDVRVIQENTLDLQLPLDLQGWKLLKRTSQEQLIQGDSLQPLLVLDRVESSLSSPINQYVTSMTNRAESKGGSWLVEYETSFSKIFQTELFLTIPVASEDIQVIGCRINNHLLTASEWNWIENSKSAMMRLFLQPNQMGIPLKISLALRLKNEGNFFFQKVPSISWGKDEASDWFVPHRWLFQAGQNQWLWWSNLAVDDWQNALSWFPYGVPHELAGTSDMHFLGTRAGEPLALITLSKTISIAIGSIIGLISVYFLTGRHASSWVLFLTGCGLLLLYLFQPVLGMVLTWSILPGVILGLLLQMWTGWRNEIRRKRPGVFQTINPTASTISYSAGKSEKVMSATESATIIRNPGKAGP